MAQDFYLNGVIKSYITGADWPDEAESQAHDGVTPYRRWQRHIWRADVMPMDEYSAIEALAGQRVTIITTDYDDRNASDYRVYFGCDLDRVSCRHESINAIGVIVEFLVRLG